MAESPCPCGQRLSAASIRAPQMEFMALLTIRLSRHATVLNVFSPGAHVSRRANTSAIGRQRPDKIFQSGCRWRDKWLSKILSEIKLFMRTSPVLCASTTSPSFELHTTSPGGLVGAEDDLRKLSLRCCAAASSPPRYLVNSVSSSAA